LGQRLVALGIVVGGLLVAGVLGHLVGRSLSSDIAWERVAGSTRRHLVVALLCSVAPPAVTGFAISLGVHQSDSLLTFVEGASFAVAFSMALLLCGLAFIRARVEPYYAAAR
jgi:hypothetical protein